MDVPLTWSLSSLSNFFLLSIFFLSPPSFSLPHRVCQEVREREREITSFLIQPFIYDRSLWWKGLLTIKTSLFLTPPGSNYKSKEEVIQFATSPWRESELSWILTNRKESFRWINMWWISSSFTVRKSNKLKRMVTCSTWVWIEDTHLMSDSKVVRNQFGSFSHLISFSVSLPFPPLEYLYSCLIACSWWWYSSSFTPLSTFITSSLPHSLWTSSLRAWVETHFSHFHLSRFLLNSFQSSLFESSSMVVTINFTNYLKLQFESNYNQIPIKCSNWKLILTPSFHFHSHFQMFSIHN